MIRKAFTAGLLVFGLLSAPATAQEEGMTAAGPTGGSTTESLPGSLETTVMVLVDPPDGTGVVNAYVLFIATNSQEYNELAWHAADPEVQVAHVNNFKIGFPPLSPLISGFTAYAPPPTLWPFEASGTVTEHQGPRDTGGTPFLLNFWHDSAHATMKFAVTVEGLEMAPAEVEIRSPGTDLGRMFGMENRATSDAVGSNHARFRRATVVRTLVQH